MKKTEVLEWAPFRLKKGVSESKLLSASSELQHEFLQNQTGFVSRQLLKISDREYVDLVRWESRQYAREAMNQAMKSPVCNSYFHLMDMDNQNPDNGVTLLEITETYV